MGAVRGGDSERIFLPHKSREENSERVRGIQRDKIFFMKKQSHMPLEMQFLMPTGVGMKLLISLNGI
jgi:hypothetical protein